MIMITIMVVNSDHDDNNDNNNNNNDRTSSTATPYVLPSLIIVLFPCNPYHACRRRTIQSTVTLIGKPFSVQSIVAQ